MITLDYSQLLISACTVFADDFQKGGDTAKMEQIAKFTVLSSILGYKKKFGDKYGKIVICCDGRNTWRRQRYQYYKAGRSKGRDESTLDWNSIFSIGADLLEDLKLNFPYKVVKVDEAEADDVIAVLCEYLQDNELDTDGLEETPQPFLNISADHDFRQLYKFKNYSQWSHMQKKVVPRPEKTFLVEKIIRGDKGDAIPSILCPDDFFVTESGRAPAVTQKVIERAMRGDLTEIEKIRYARNEMLISFDSIPQDIKDKIISTYTAFEIKGNKSTLFNYFIKQRMKRFMENIQEF